MTRDVRRDARFAVQTKSAAQIESARKHCEISIYVEYRPPTSFDNDRAYWSTAWAHAAGLLARLAWQARPYARRERIEHGCTGAPGWDTCDVSAADLLHAEPEPSVVITIPKASMPRWRQLVTEWLDAIESTDQVDQVEANPPPVQLAERRRARASRH